MSSLVQAGVCASCNAKIFEGDSFCQACGTRVSVEAAPQQAAPAPEPEKVVVYVEQPVAFASGLPEWSIEPPAVVVRRKARR